MRVARRCLFVVVCCLCVLLVGGWLVVDSCLMFVAWCLLFLIDVMCCIFCLRCVAICVC